ncbi:helix-turn-helix domain-containing protein [Streptosporangium algeriense]|uniref:Helix-turn-helix domain-containing protein n=1 Tax=Streptosporangium algeriense TaxID=1682748 RepID=A0ABW3DUA7_9ACTN
MSVSADLEHALHDADLDVSLRAVARLRQLVERLEAERVAEARRAGWSWQEIATRLSVTKQTVHRKHRRDREG